VLGEQGAELCLGAAAAVDGVDGEVDAVAASEADQVALGASRLQDAQVP